MKIITVMRIPKRSLSSKLEKKLYMLLRLNIYYAYNTVLLLWYNMVQFCCLH